MAKTINKYRKSPEQRQRDKLMVERWKWPKLPRLIYRIYIKSYKTNQFILLRYNGYIVRVHNEEEAQHKLAMMGIDFSRCRLKPERKPNVKRYGDSSAG